MRFSHAIAGVVLAVAATVSLAACSESSTTSEDSEPMDGKYTQTWTKKSYSQTKCVDWNAEMTDKQQWVAAADMLNSARNKIDGGEGLPPDVLITSFQGDITESCEVDKVDSIATIAAVLYKIGRDTYAP